MTAVPLTARDEISVSTGRRSRLLQPTLILVGLIVAVLSSLGAPLIPSIAADSHVSLSTADWLLTITLLTGALSTPVLGKLSDGPHQKRVITFALAVVLAGSVLAALTSTFALLVVARGLQGLGLGLLPVTMAIARRHLAGPDAARAIALLSVTAAVGVGLGYPVTGLLAEVSDYHLAFWFGAFVVGLAFVASLIVLPGRSPVATKRFDVFGASMLIVAVTALIVMLSEASDWGWTSLPTVGLRSTWSHPRDPGHRRRRVTRRLGSSRRRPASIEPRCSKIALAGGPRWWRGCAGWRARTATLSVAG